jgi:hypothetical protein
MKEFFVVSGEKMLGMFYNYEQAMEFLFKYVEYNPNDYPEIVDHFPHELGVK